MTPGEVIADRYRLTKKLGAGGMGEVWAASNLSTDRTCAIKFLHSHVAGSAEARARFLREARASARINHVNVVDVYDVGELPDGGLFFTLELLDGVPLSDAMRQNPPLPVPDFLVVLADAAKALAAAHAAGIVHRDIKPGNIFLHRDKGQDVAHGKVLDFGISKFVGDEATATGSLLGSPHYMAPEQVQHSRGVDARADIWAMGVILFRGLTGKWPHFGEGYHQIILAVANEAPLRIDDVAPELPEALRRIVRHCMTPVEHRLGDASTLASWLEQAAGLQEVQHLQTQTAGETVTASTGIKVRTPVTTQRVSGATHMATTAPTKRRPLSTVGLVIASVMLGAGGVAIAMSGYVRTGSTPPAAAAPPSDDAAADADNPVADEPGSVDESTDEAKADDDASGADEGSVDADATGGAGGGSADEDDSVPPAPDLPNPPPPKTAGPTPPPYKPPPAKPPPSTPPPPSGLPGEELGSGL